MKNVAFELPIELELANPLFLSLWHSTLFNFKVIINFNTIKSILFLINIIASLTSVRAIASHLFNFFFTTIFLKFVFSDFRLAKTSKIGVIKK